MQSALVPVVPASASLIKTLRATKKRPNAALTSATQGWGDQSASNVLADDNLSPLRAPLIVSRSQETREAKGSIASLRDGLSEAVAGGHHVMDSMYDMADVIQRGGEVHVNGGDLPLLLAELQMQRARERLQELRDLYLEVSKEIAHDPAALRQTAAAYAEQEQQQLETEQDGANLGSRQIDNASLAWDVISIVLAPLAPLAPGILRQVKKDGKYDPWAALAAFIEPTGKYYKYCMFGDIVKLVREHEAAPAKSDEDPWGWMMTRMLGKDTHSKYDPLDSRPLQSISPGPVAVGSAAEEQLRGQVDCHQHQPPQHFYHPQQQNFHVEQQQWESPAQLPKQKQYWQLEGWAVESAELVSSRNMALAEERRLREQTNTQAEKQEQERWHSSLPPVDPEIFRYN